MTKPIQVEIYGQRYTIRGEADEQYIKRVAAYVDEHMHNLAKGMKTATLSKLAVLAAINIAHQLLQAEERREQGEADVEQRLVSLMDTIEEEMPASGYR